MRENKLFLFQFFFIHSTFSFLFDTLHTWTAHYVPYYIHLTVQPTPDKPSLCLNQASTNKHKIHRINYHMVYTVTSLQFCPKWKFTPKCLHLKEESRFKIEMCWRQLTLCLISGVPCNNEVRMENCKEWCVPALIQSFPPPQFSAFIPYAANNLTAADWDNARRERDII